MRTHVFGLFGSALLVLTALCGCGGGGDGDASAASSPGAGSGQPVHAPAGPREACPLTAAEVGEAVGVTVHQEPTVCMFEPEPGTEPRVLYVRQVSFACSDSVVNDPSFDLEPYDGLGIGAYASAVRGHVLVCTNPPFEITVDITPALDDIIADANAASAAARAAERTAAEQLARLVLAR